MTEADWRGPRGEEYTRRWQLEPPALDKLWKRMAGVTRTLIYDHMLPTPKLMPTHVLEMGCNCGNQLRHLEHLGHSPERLWGVDVNRLAVKTAAKRGYNAVLAPAAETPFRSGFFGVVMCCGVLSHVDPEDLPSVFDEIRRLRPTWILITEYCDGQVWNGFRHGELSAELAGQGLAPWKPAFAPMIHSKGQGSDMFTTTLNRGGRP